MTILVHLLQSNPSQLWHTVPNAYSSKEWRELGRHLMARMCTQDLGGPKGTDADMYALMVHLFPAIEPAFTQQDQTYAHHLMYEAINHNDITTLTQLLDLEYVRTVSGAHWEDTYIGHAVEHAVNTQNLQPLLLLLAHYTPEQTDLLTALKARNTNTVNALLPHVTWECCTQTYGWAYLNDALVPQLDEATDKIDALTSFHYYDIQEFSDNAPHSMEKIKQLFEQIVQGRVNQPSALLCRAVFHNQPFELLLEQVTQEQLEDIVFVLAHYNMKGARRLLEKMDQVTEHMGEILFVYFAPHIYDLLVPKIDANLIQKSLRKNCFTFRDDAIMQLLLQYGADLNAIHKYFQEICDGDVNWIDDGTCLSGLAYIENFMAGQLRNKIATSLEDQHIPQNHTSGRKI